MKMATRTIEFRNVIQRGSVLCMTLCCWRRRKPQQDEEQRRIECTQAKAQRSCGRSKRNLSLAALTQMECNLRTALGETVKAELGKLTNEISELRMSLTSYGESPSMQQELPPPPPPEGFVGIFNAGNPHSRGALEHGS